MNINAESANKLIDTIHTDLIDIKQVTETSFEQMNKTVSESCMVLQRYLEDFVERTDSIIASFSTSADRTISAAMPKMEQSLKFMQMELDYSNKVTEAVIEMSANTKTVIEKLMKDVATKNIAEHKTIDELYDSYNEIQTSYDKILSHLSFGGEGNE